MSAPIRSMTGFARLQKSTDNGDIVVSLKSVNHRGLDLHFHLGSDLDPLENAMRTVIKRSVLRGHIDVRCSMARPSNGSGGLNLSLLRSYMAAFRQAANEEGINNAQPDLNRILQLPGMFGATSESEFEPTSESAVVS